MKIEANQCMRECNGLMVVDLLEYFIVSNSISQELERTKN